MKDQHLIYKLNTKPNRKEQYKAYQKKNRAQNWIILMIFLQLLWLHHIVIDLYIYIWITEFMFRQFYTFIIMTINIYTYKTTVVFYLFLIASTHSRLLSIDRSNIKRCERKKKSKQNIKKMINSLKIDGWEKIWL